MEENKEIAGIDKTAEAIAAIVERYKGVTTIKDTAGYDLVVAGIRECREFRGDVEKDRKSAVRGPLDFIAATNKEAQRITAEVVAIETPLKALKIAEDDRKAEIRMQKEREEDARRDGILEKIAAFGSDAMPNWTVQQYDDAIALLVAHEITEPEYQELLARAILFHESALTSLRASREARVVVEKEQEDFRIAQALHAEEMAKLQAAQKKIDVEKEAHRLGVRAEEERLQNIADEQAEDKRRQETARNNIDGITDTIQHIHMLNADGMRDLIDVLEKCEITEDEYYNQVEKAEGVKASMLEQLRGILAQKVKTEAAEKKLQADQAELAATQKADQDRKDKDAADQVAAEEKAADKLKKEQEAKEESERVERLRPDNEKLLALAKDIEGIVFEAPDVESVEASGIKATALAMLLKAKDYIETAVK